MTAVFIILHNAKSFVFVENDNFFTICCVADFKFPQVQNFFEIFLIFLKKTIAFTKGSLYNIGDVRVSLGENADSRQKLRRRRQEYVITFGGQRVQKI